jgi:GPH family glycoside/pentoside/hexuronide:cation symporter
MAGTIASITSIVDACLSWIYGGIINAVKPGKFGRYRTWLILLTWLVPFIFAFQFIRVSDNDVLSAVVICAAFIVSHVCWNLPYCANAAMVSIAGGTPEGRAELASNRATWNNLSGVLFSYAFTGVSAILAGSAIEANGLLYAVVAFLFGVVMVIGYFIHFKITDGYEEIEDPNAPKTAAKSATPKDMAKALAENPPLLILVVADLAKWIVKFLVASSAVYYFVYVMGTGYQANYMLLANLMGVIGAFAARFIAKKLTSRGAMIAAYAWMALFMITSYFLYANPLVVFILMVIGQFGYGVAYAASPALYADTAIYARWKSGKDSTGFIMGLQNVPLKIGVLVKSVLLNTALGLAGYDAYKAAIDAKDLAALPESLKQGVCGAFSLWSGIFCAIGLLVLVFGFKLTKEKVEQYQAEIDARG